MSRIAHLLLTAAAALALNACASEPEPVDPAAEADAFSQRIKSNAAATDPAATGAAAPLVTKPLPGAAPGPFIAGTQTDPASATCGANKMGPYIGKVADEATRLEIVTVLGRKDNLRFVAFGSGGYINPDPTNPRLNLMLDAQDIIRDARCG